MKDGIAVFWFRRDLRLNDNAGLYEALRSGMPVLPLFIFDRHILDKLENPHDARVTFLHDTLHELSGKLNEMGASLEVRYGYPEEVWSILLSQYPIRAVFANHDYEPYAITRDEGIRVRLEALGIPFHTFKDHVIFEKEEVVKDDGSPYTVFTPYSRKWKAKLQERFVSVIKEGATETIPHYLAPYPVEPYLDRLYRGEQLLLPGLDEMGFQRSKVPIPPKVIPRNVIGQYAAQRDYPAVAGTSRLGVHFRFGTVSVREKALRALALSETFLNELIWRDFYAMILYHFPQVVTRAFRPEYDRIAWRNDPVEFERWCEGRTGYPLVDAGMRELNATGYMHNRVRMVVASFLTKHLLIDWRWGEAYFAARLLDFDLASNNGGWQWAAGCGTDAAPYFRIFNPQAQQEKFDKSGAYIKKWVAEWGTPLYPQPIVDHAFARERCLQAYRAALKDQ